MITSDAKGVSSSPAVCSINASPEGGPNNRPKQGDHNHEPNQSCDGQTKDYKDRAKHYYEQDRKQNRVHTPAGLGFERRRT
jgi:hypothetical protein